MKQYKFGKLPKKSDYRTLRLSKYIRQLTPPPTYYDTLPIVYAMLGEEKPDASVIFPMDGNDRFGDCVVAGMAHAMTVYSGLIGERVIPPEKWVTETYFQLTGGEDTGYYLLDMLKFWSKLPKQEIVYAEIDPHNHTHVKQAIQRFGGVYLGFQVPEQCMDEFDAGKVWTPGNLTYGGHCVHAVAYDRETVTVLTWGAVQKGTWAWWSKCVDEAYAVLPPQAASPDFCPGFDMEQMQKDLQAVAG